MVLLAVIPEIDDELPAYFDWQPEQIVNAYIVRKVADEVVTKMNFNSGVSRRKRVQYIQAGVMPKSGGEDIDFSDIFVTNTSRKETEEEGQRCTPHEVRASVDTYAIVTDDGKYFVHHEHQPEKIYVTSSITADCLLKEVKWRYVRDDNLNKGYVDRLYLKKLDGTVVVLHQNDTSDNLEQSINRDRQKSSSDLVDPDEFANDWDGEVKGVFIITNFDRDQLITTLRICGSLQREVDGNMSQARDCFKQAMEYYSLWDLAESAESVLKGSLLRKTTRKSLSCFNQIPKFLYEYDVLPDYDRYRWERMEQEYDSLLLGGQV